MVISRHQKRKKRKKKKIGLVDLLKGAHHLFDDEASGPRRLISDTSPSSCWFFEGIIQHCYHKAVLLSNLGLF